MIDEGKGFWLADEFCSTLDRTTARIVAYNIQRLARRCGATLVVATTHTDLEDDLSPSICVRKGWGEEIDVDYGSNVEAPKCSVTGDISIREGSREDYEKLGHLHYRDSRLPVPRGIYAMERRVELVGVVVYSYPLVRASGRRRAVGYAPGVEELNEDWAVISRVIVHPKYRAIGLGSRLVRETLRMQDCGHVELIAVMSRYNPFAEGAGMRLIQVLEPHASVAGAVEGLRGLGFNPVMMASVGYNRGGPRGAGRGGARVPEGGPPGGWRGLLQAPREDGEGIPEEGGVRGVAGGAADREPCEVPGGAERPEPVEGLPVLVPGLVGGRRSDGGWE
jgi:GNAT superfamily N-acetyltransferase